MFLRVEAQVYRLRFSRLCEVLRGLEVGAFQVLMGLGMWLKGFLTCGLDADLGSKALVGGREVKGLPSVGSFGCFCSLPKSRAPNLDPNDRIPHIRTSN